MNTIDDAALIESLRQQMTKSVARQVAAAGNLANVDTPNYKAVEPTFADTLKGQLQMTATRSGHINPGDASKPQVREIKDAVARRDGNTVELDRELLTMTPVYFALAGPWSRSARSVSPPASPFSQIVSGLPA